ncbi:superoxide dismutase [Bacillus coahuilensis p1.1.43]|uniref:Superoxide dismutase [Cu-Zn] n=1 Tax=Bacillus coahuilensis p1.1.43 TaxID=1150625 RepID=A0A147K673_9BACI|nr:superoxide dismutase family protein [Bacillus coahuilensis]KUP05341.1 superoxide dismutase [Bacillus coahuilensis p1.1.43]
MKKWIAIFSLFFITGCVYPDVKKIEIDMMNSDQDSYGTVLLQEVAEGVNMTIDLEGLPPGEHAMHFHGKRGSVSHQYFTSAGDHYNPEDKQHGLLNPEGAHAGDLPNLVVGEDGVASVEILAPSVTLSEGTTTLFTKQGTSLIIHEAGDDGMSQPAGDAGVRIACGVISKENQTMKEVTENETEAPDQKEE